ncbi:MAG: hypothetical protein J6W35_05030 [Eubacterium sp.]|nr:hypothetical protein [Eubacterium sp.]
MERLLKRVVSVVCAIAMVVTCLTFTPATVDAANKLPTDEWKNVGAWQLYNGNDQWCSWATMEYTSAGQALGDTTCILTNSPNGEWNDVEYGLGAKLKEYSDGKMEADKRYDCNVTITATKAGTLIADIEGKEYRKSVPASDSPQTITVATFDHDAFAPTTDVTFYYGMFPTDTEITISAVDFVLNDDGWTPVKNTDPDKDPVFVQAGAFTLNAMFSPKYTLYGKMKYKNNGGTDLDDTTIKVTSVSGFHNAWSVSASLKNYCETAVVDGQPGLASGDKYMPTIKVKSSKKTTEDEHGKMQTVMVVISGTTYEFPLTAEPGEENVFTVTDAEKAFKYNSSKPDVDFELDCVEKDTELTITEVSFEAVDKDWTKVPNEATIDTGKWQLFARTGTTIEEGQWGALSYKTEEPASSMADTQIKVRSSSGWHNAWATLAMLPNYLEDAGLEVGRTYKPVLTYSSTKATGIDDSGDPKTVLLSIDNTNIKFSLEKATSKTITLDAFTFEAQKPEKPNDVVFNLDQVEPDTILNFESLTFEPVDDGWIPIPNRRYTAVGNTGMELYARMGETVQEGSWGKTSYRYDDGYDETTTDFSKVTIKTRTTSGWFVTNNPASIVDFPGLAAEKMKEANRYKVRVVINADRTREQKDLDGSGAEEEGKNNIKLVVDGTKEYLYKDLPDGEDFALETEEFVYQKNSDDLRLVLDEFTKNATLKVKKIEFIKNEDDPTWVEVPNASATRVGAWTLYANFNAQDDVWGRMFYANSVEEPTKMGETTLYAYSTSGWFGARSIRAILNNYTKGLLSQGAVYSVAITINSSEDCYGLDDYGNEKGMRVTIDNNDYTFPIYQGQYTYVIPALKPYSNTGADNVQFNLDVLKPTTVINISDVEFDDEIKQIPEIKNMTATPQANGQVKVDWEQTENTVYGTVNNVGSFEVYVDGNKVGTPKGNERTFTTGILSEGKHSVKVVAVLGANKTTGQELEVVVSKETQTQAPTEAPTQAPTQKPTVTPVTTKAPVVAKPGKASVKKAVKKKKSAKKIKVTLKKVAGATKYQVAVYKTKKNAKKNKKALVKKMVTKLKVTIKSKKLKGKKTVYVRARAWNTAGFGAWSGVKKSKKK